MKLIIFSVFFINLFAYGLPVCKRTQQVRDEIVKKLQEGMEDTSINCKLADSLLHTIQILFLRNQNITSLKRGDFSRLSSLEKLFLYDNKLSTLPTGLFSELSSLKEIWLSYNNLSELPADLFLGLSSLEYIYLNNNNLSKLPPGLFLGLFSLREITLSNNSIPQSEKERINFEANNK